MSKGKNRKSRIQRNVKKEKGENNWKIIIQIEENGKKKNVKGGWGGKREELKGSPESK